MKVAKTLIFAAILLLCPIRLLGEGGVLSLVPQPRNVELGGGFFAYSGHLAVVCDDSVETYVKEYLGGGFGPVGVAVWCDPKMKLPEGGYKLNITPLGVSLCAPPAGGIAQWLSYSAPALSSRSLWA